VYGSQASSGVTKVAYNESLRNSQGVTAMRAKVTVNAFEANACPDAGSGVGQSRARLVGAFFNVQGTPTPGSQLGDVIAQFRIRRLTNSIDAAGLLQVQGLVSVCADTSCSTGPVVGQPEFGLIGIGQSTVLQMEWDNASSSFYFSRDGAPGQTVSYAGVSLAVGPLGLVPVVNASAPLNPFRQLSTRLEVPNCASAQKVGLIDASFDNFYVNAP
jgi:hypothetical protein